MFLSPHQLRTCSPANKKNVFILQDMYWYETGMSNFWNKDAVLAGCTKHSGYKRIETSQFLNIINYFKNCNCNTKHPYSCTKHFE
jgi:hypothetical protein